HSGGGRYPQIRKLHRPARSAALFDREDRGPVMANSLTGEYEAVVQASIRQINGLLATLHQNGAKGSGLTPNFPHSVGNLRVGDVPAYLQPATFQFSQWLSRTVQSFQSAGGTAVTGAELAAKAPPGIAARFQTALNDIASTWTEMLPAGSVRGRAEVQVSTPMLSLEPRTSDVVITVEIRARFVPDPGSAGLAEPIHGRLQVTYQVRPRTMPDGKRVLTIEVPAQDDKIIYTDLGGLSTGDVAALSGR